MQSRRHSASFCTSDENTNAIQPSPLKMPCAHMTETSIFCMIPLSRFSMLLYPSQYLKVNGQLNHHPYTLYYTTTNPKCQEKSPNRRRVKSINVDVLGKVLRNLQRNKLFALCCSIWGGVWRYPPVSTQYYCTLAFVKM